MHFQTPLRNDLGVVCPSFEEFQLALRRHGFTLFDNDSRPYNLNIVGWRYTKGRVNRYDDFIAIYCKIQGEWRVEAWEATTKPGTPYLKIPINPKGTGILAPGQYRNCYALGKHKGKYEALIQIGKVRVYRDNNYDGNIDLHLASIEEGYFGMNIHKGGVIDTYVNRNSAGCQVFRRQKDFEKFMRIVRSASGYWGKTFTYTLLEF